MRKEFSLHEPLVKTMIINTLFLRSGTHRVAMTLDVKELARTVKELVAMRNDNSFWNDIETPWRECERILSNSTLNRSCAHKAHNGIDPFATLSVFEGTKKIHSVW